MEGHRLAPVDASEREFSFLSARFPRALFPEFESVKLPMKTVLTSGSCGKSPPL